MPENKKTLWYAAGLHFECQQCGACCSGPNQGYIWVTRPEIKLIADFLKVEPKQLQQKYLRRVGFRTTIIEQPVTRDCVFLRRVDGKKRCVIYSVRPNQCRTWPFWPENLVNADEWNSAVQRCGGINRGRLYSFEEIKEVKSSKKWWQSAKKTAIW